MPAPKAFDIVIYGATGFTGRLATEYFANNADKSLKWAIAGRRKDALTSLAEAYEPLAGKIPVIVADAYDNDSIEAMTAATRVILTTVGPFAIYGEPVIRACIKSSTDYVDISGEVSWHNRMIEKYDAQAKAKGIRVIPSCGFDSVPSDIGTLFAADTLRNAYPQANVKDVRAYFDLFGGFNGGTIASGLNAADSSDLKESLDPLALVPKELQTEDNRNNNKDWLLPSYNSDLGIFAGPFFMQFINARLVRRSNALLRQRGQGYSDNFQYQEYMHMFNNRILSLIPAFFISIFILIMAAGSAFKPLRELVRFVLPKPGNGTPKFVRDMAYFKTNIVATAETGEKAHVYVADRGDPGNEVTVKCISECALALVLDKDKLPNVSGFQTPATGLGSHLYTRLQNAGMKFEVKRTWSANKKEQ